MMQDLAWVFVSSALISNVVLTLFLGLCSFFGVSNKLDTAIRLGAANTFVLVITSLASSLLEATVIPHAPYLRLISYILIIASTVQFVEMVIKKTSPALFRALGIYLPLITTNCAVLWLALQQQLRDYDVWQGLAFALGTGAGFTLAIALLAGIREESELADVPKILRGTALNLFTAGLLSLAFMGFAGLFSTGE